MSHAIEPVPKKFRPAPEHTASPDDPEAFWKKELARASTSAHSLLQRLDLLHLINETDQETDFTCLATDTYIDKIKTGDPNDPLLLQILPLNKEHDENIQSAGSTDPVGDIEALASQGLIHKYHGRALLISTGACAIHCRYCFRRHYPYQQASYSSKALHDVTHYLEQHTGIEEIILSGGDPLVLDNNKLSGLLAKLETIEHIKTLRIHTRIPVVLPGRINNGLLDLLQSSRFHIVMVIHSNHANELQQTECTNLHRLHHAGVTLLNQSVLLKGINDNADILVELSKRLFQCKTLPYYLHLLDPVTGAMHFDAGTEKALDLKTEMERQLPGYLVPRLVQEIAGNKSKTAIFRI
ncbi:MAG TPA: EF-P beta-lysylation protein EpmB [Gammaproteobacteria bacterium]|nr:EF-P beta-lysylation protein EpmB [Gammaproteobacteria bacterium]